MCAFRKCKKSSTTTPTIRSASKPIGGAATYLLLTRGVNIEAGVYLPLFAIGTVDSRHRLGAGSALGHLSAKPFRLAAERAITGFDAASGHAAHRRTNRSLDPRHQHQRCCRAEHGRAGTT